MITITESTVAKVKELLLEEGDPAQKLRIFVQGGGCSGMSYGFAFDSETNEDDFVLHKDGVEILVDSISAQYITGATIDYKESLMGAGFSIDNPNAETSCGCGSSFSVADSFYDDLGVE